jgi:hypothetical protein
MKLTFGNDRVYGLTFIPADGDTLPSAIAPAAHVTVNTATVRHGYTKRLSIAWRRMDSRSEAEAKRWHPMSGQ